MPFGHSLLTNFGPLVFVCITGQQKTLNFVGDHPMYIPTKFGTNRLSGFKDKD